MILLKDPNSSVTAVKDLNTGKLSGASLQKLSGEKIDWIQGLERKVTNKVRTWENAQESQNDRWRSQKPERKFNNNKNWYLKKKKANRTLETKVSLTQAVNIMQNIKKK